MNSKILGLVAFLAIFGQQANAAVVINFVETGGNVQATLSGSVNLAALGPVYNPLSVPFNAFIANSGWFGLANGPGPSYLVNTPWTPFGASGLVFWDSSSGDSFALYSNPALGLPLGYVSGSSMSATGIKFGASFASLGLTPGSYVTTLTGAVVNLGVGDVNGGISETVTVNIGQNPVPLPAAAWLLLSGLGGLGFLARRRKD